MAHTPGPWAYDEDSSEVYSEADGYGTGWIALVKGNDDAGVSFPETMRLANARLIAAAPELLAALMGVADGCEYRLRKGEDSGDRAALRLCRAAIAKATGKESE